MAEENKNAAPEEEYNDDGSKNPDFIDPNAGGESAGAGTENKGTDGEGIDVEEKEVEGFDDTINPEKPPEIPVRKSVEQHIIARKNEKIKKLESKINEPNDDQIDNGSDDDEDNLTPEAREAIDKVVNKRLAPLLGKLASETDENEFKELIKVEPEAEKYANHIKAYMAHDAYKGVSPIVIYHHLAWTKAQALGAKKKAAADLEANQNKSGGRTVVDNTNLGDFPSAQEIEEMSDADFSKMEEDALRGKFTKK